MEETKLQALADSLSKHGGRKGLGLSGGEYSWSKTNNRNEAGVDDGEQRRNDGLPNNALFSNFVREGTYDLEASRGQHGDGRTIKRDFSDIHSDDKAAKKASKKAAKIEAKRQVKLEEKRKAKRARKEQEAALAAAREKCYEGKYLERNKTLKSSGRNIIEVKEQQQV